MVKGTGRRGLRTRLTLTDEWRSTWPKGAITGIRILAGRNWKYPPDRPLLPCNLCQFGHDLNPHSRQLFREGQNVPANARRRSWACPTPVPSTRAKVIVAGAGVPASRTLAAMAIYLLSRMPWFGVTALPNMPALTCPFWSARNFMAFPNAQNFAQAIPPQVVSSNQLLARVSGPEPPAPGPQQAPTALHQLHDRQHFAEVPEFQIGKQVRSIFPPSTLPVIAIEFSPLRIVSSRPGVSLSGGLIWNFVPQKRPLPSRIEAVT